MKGSLLRRSTVCCGFLVLALAGCGGREDSTNNNMTSYTVGFTVTGLGAAESVSLVNNGGSPLTASTQTATSLSQAVRLPARRMP